MSDLFGQPENKILKKHAKIENYSMRQRLGDEWYAEDDMGASLKRLITDKRVLIIFSIFIIGMLILMGKLFWLQMFRGNYYRSIAEGNRIRIQEIKADRGLIFDNQDRQLVENLPDFYLTVVAAELPNQDEDFFEVVKKVENIFGLEISQKLIDIRSGELTYLKLRL